MTKAPDGRPVLESDRPLTISDRSKDRRLPREAAKRHLVVAVTSVIAICVAALAVMATKLF